MDAQHKNTLSKPQSAEILVTEYKRKREWWRSVKKPAETLVQNHSEGVC